MTVALACAIAAIEILLFALANAPRKPPVAEAPVTVSVLAFERPRATPTPRPTPQPTPVPTHPPRLRHVVVATPEAVVATAQPAPRAAQVRTVSLGHGSAAKRAPHIVRVAAKPAPVGGSSIGAGAIGTGANAGTAAGTGSGGLAGAGGAGQGGAGNGNGGAPADIPCGFVELHPVHAPRFLKNGRVFETMAATVHFPDGTTDTGTFPYEFAYATEAIDPFAFQNINKPDMLALVQLPPPGTDMSGASAVIAIVLKHTGPDGLTNFRECPPENG